MLHNTGKRFYFFLAMLLFAAASVQAGEEIIYCNIDNNDINLMSVPDKPAPIGAEIFLRNAYGNLEQIKKNGKIELLKNTPRSDWKNIWEKLPGFGIGAGMYHNLYYMGIDNDHNLYLNKYSNSNTGVVFSYVVSLDENNEGEFSHMFNFSETPVSFHVKVTNNWIQVRITNFPEYPEDGLRNLIY